jgi:hypothetical protein
MRPLSAEAANTFERKGRVPEKIKLSYACSRYAFVKKIAPGKDVVLPITEGIQSFWQTPLHPHGVRLKATPNPNQGNDFNLSQIF